MTRANQDFTLYIGDDSLPIFTVYDSLDDVLDISSVTQITWAIQRTPSSTAVLSKSKTGGKIAFTTDGTDGQFQVDIDETDLDDLSGYYVHVAKITDAYGNISTVTLGRVQIGRAPVWTYSGDPTTSDKDAVRFLIGDVLNKDPLVQDGEIAYALTLRGTVYGAAATCCRSLAAQYSRLADSVQADLRTTYSQKATAFARRARDFDSQDTMLGGALSWAGGISIADKQSREEDTDRVQPAFNIGMDDNSLPVAAAGTEHPVTGTDEADGD